MTKKEIVRRISDRAELTQLKTKEIVQWTFDAIIDTLIKDGRIELRNFGVFEVRRRKAAAGAQSRGRMTGSMCRRRTSYLPAGQGNGRARQQRSQGLRTEAARNRGKRRPLCPLRLLAQVEACRQTKGSAKAAKPKSPPAAGTGSQFPFHRRHPFRQSSTSSLERPRRLGQRLVNSVVASAPTDSASSARIIPKLATPIIITDNSTPCRRTAGHSRSSANIRRGQ